MSAATYDLTQKLIPFLDRHLILPLLAHLAEAELFPAEQIARAQYELVKETNMLDYAASLFESAYPDEEVPSGKLYLLCRSRGQNKCLSRRSRLRIVGSRFLTELIYSSICCEAREGCFRKREIATRGADRARRYREARSRPGIKTG